MEETECYQCGKSLNLYPSELRKRNFCGRDCQNKWQATDRTYETNNVELTCEFCKEKYEVNPSRESKSRFCSQECQLKSYNKKRSKTHTLCHYCSKKFEINAAQKKRTDKNFCSTRCHGDWKKENWSRENHPSWKEETKSRQRYGYGWSRIREEILNRDEVCQICEDNGENTTLDVHHIKPLRKCDNFEEANDKNNLILLCRSCHMQVEHDKISLEL